MRYVILFVIVMYAGMWLARRSKSKGLATIMCSVMVCISGLRRGYIDTRAYRLGFISLDVSEVLNWTFLTSGQSRDRGFSFLSAVIKLFTDNSQVFLFILALVTVGCLFWGIVNRVPQAELGIFFFITTGCFIDTMNGVRQYLVSALLFFFLPQLLEERKFIKYMVVVILLSTVHGSALLFIPIYFIATKKAWSGSTYGVIGVCLLAYMLFNSGIGSLLVEILDGTSYGSDYSDMILAGNTSVNIIRIFVVAVPIILAFVNKNCDEKKGVMYSIAFNMSIINLMTWIFATKVLYFYRLAMYFTPYMILLLCYEIRLVQNMKYRRLITYASVGCYFIYHLYSMHVTGDAIFIGYMKY